MERKKKKNEYIFPLISNVVHQPKQVRRRSFFFLNVVMEVSRTFHLSQNATSYMDDFELVFGKYVNVDSRLPRTRSSEK